MNILPLFLAGLVALLSCASAHAQKLTILKNFGDAPGDGVIPDYYGALVGDTYIGATVAGGANGLGTLYSIKTDGSDYTVIHDFSEIEGGFPGPGYSRPRSALIYEAGRVHGVLRADSAWPVDARFFSVLPDGSDFRIDREVVDGEWIPDGNGGYRYRNEGYDLGVCFLRDGYLYGFAEYGAAPETSEWSQGYGGIFRVRPDGTDYTVLHRFTDLLNGRRPVTLVDGGDFLYGVASEGGLQGAGIIFRIRPDGTDFAKMKDLLISEVGQGGGWACDVRYHKGQLFFSSGWFGGRDDDGVMMAFDALTGDLSWRFEFADAPTFEEPVDFLVGDDGIFGVMGNGDSDGRFEDGGMYRMNLDGSGFQELVGFEPSSSGGLEPKAIVRQGTTFYGVLARGGTSSSGALFSFDPSGVPVVQPPSTPPSSVMPKSARLTGMSVFGQPTMARWNHSVLWTGSRFVVWGGVTGGSTVASGGIYNPETDAWVATSPSGAPAARSRHTAVWDDKANRMIIWGGVDSGGKPLNDGFLFDPAGNTWVSLPTAGAPSARSGHTAVWTGTEMIIWGGSEGQTDGAIYNPETGTWRPVSTTDAPASRIGHGAVWTGTRMAVWGGSVGGSEQANGTGAFYDPASDSWEEIIASNAPSGGYGELGDDSEAKAVELLWTGSKLVAFPLNSLSPSFWTDGGLYDPASQSWQRIGTVGAPKVRPYMAAWVGSTLYVAGSSGTKFQGAVYDFESDRWKVLTRATTGSFQGRKGVWAEDIGEFLVFGGRWADGQDEYSGGANGRKGFRIKFDGLSAPIDWTWTENSGNREVSVGDSASFGVQVASGGAFTYQWFKDGKKLNGAVGPNLNINADSPAKAGLYHVEIASATDKTVKVATPGLQLTVADPGILVYTFRGREIYSDHTGEETLPIGGYFLIDRQNELATDILIDKKAKKFRVNASPDGNGGSPFRIRVFSTGPLPSGTRSTFSYTDTGGYDVSVAWFSGPDKLVPLDSRNAVVAPPTLTSWAGQAVEDTATNETFILNSSFSMRLDKGQTLRARSQGIETLLQTVGRLREELNSQGLTEQ